MIVNDLDISRAILGPAENYAPLGINTNAIEALEIAPQWLKPIARRRSQVIKHLRSIQNIEFVQCEFVNLGGKPSGITAGQAMKKVRSTTVAKRCNHIPRITDSRTPCNALFGQVTPTSTSKFWLAAFLPAQRKKEDSKTCPLQVLVKIIYSCNHFETILQL